MIIPTIRDRKLVAVRMNDTPISPSVLAELNSLEGEQFAWLTQDEMWASIRSAATRVRDEAGADLHLLEHL